MNIRKKTFVLIITYLAAAIAALGAYTALHYGMERSYRRTAEYGYAHSFEELVYAASELESALHRASYATGAELSGELCADIYADCLAAEMSMAALPFSTQELERTAAFIGLAGDYAHSRLRVSAQSGFDDAARQRFAELYETAAHLNSELSTLRDSVNDGEVLLDEPENVFASSGERLSGRMLGMEDGTAVPELGAYGGRYAEEPAQERSKAAIPQAEAKAAAADFFGLDADKLEAEYTASDGTVCFGFDGGSVCVDASGSVLSLSSERSVAGDIGSDELERTAREFLAAHGFGELYLVSSERLGSVQTMVFDCVRNGVRCMGDSVRISVAGDTGGIYAYDAAEHLKRHGSYPAAGAAVSESTAREALPSTLCINSTQLCYAEADDGSAVLCYAFDCTGSGGDELLVLVNAQTALQHNVLVAHF